MASPREDKRQPVGLTIRRRTDLIDSQVVLNSHLPSMGSPDDVDHLSERLQRILHSNDPVDEAGSILLNRYIQDREQDLASNRGEAASLAQQILELKEKEEALLDLMAKQEEELLVCKQRLRRSIMTLPPELLEMIFCLSIPTALLLCGRHPLTYRDQPPFTLICVCRQWRELALAIPSLWAPFTVRNINNLPLKISNALEFKEAIRIHYSRARDLPKSLAMHIQPVRRLPVVTHSEEVIEVASTASAFFDNSLDIKYLTLSSPRLDLLLRTLGNSRTMEWWTTQTLASIESLVLCASDSYMPVQRAELFSRKRLRALRRVSLCFGQHVSPPRLMETYFLPWKNLTHVAVTSWMDYRRWAEFFPVFTSLQRGLFYISDDLQEEVEVPRPTTFAGLVELALMFDKEGGLARTLTFERHNYPVLERLRLGAYDQPSKVQAFEFKNVRGALGRLTELALFHLSWEMPVVQLLEVLQVTEGLKKLELGVSTNYDQLLQHFQVDWEGVALLPKLEEFTIDCTPTGYSRERVHPVPVLLVLTSDAFTGMVKDRWRPPVETISQLRRARLYLRKGQGHERMLKGIKVALKEEMKEGLALEVGETSKPQWVDPIMGQPTHWHEGLVVDALSDCAGCLREREQERMKGGTG